MHRSLPPAPSLERLKKEAKDLLRQHQHGEPAAIATLKLLPRFAEAADPDILQSAISLADAQQALAMDYGYKNWNTLRKLVTETFTPDKDLPAAEYYEDYRWNRGTPLGIGPVPKPRADRPFLKFIRLPNGVRVEQYGPNRAFIAICHDPSDREYGDRKLYWRDNTGQGGAARLDSTGRVQSYERYTVLVASNPPLVKAESYNADGRLIEIHTPFRVSDTAEDIHVTDRLGKLKVILHHRGINKGEPYDIEEEWPA